MIEPTLIHLKRSRKGKNGLAMLLCQNAPCAEARSVADTVHLIDNRDRWIAWPHEIGMQGVDMSLGLNRALRCDQRLPNHLPAENPLPADLWTVAAEQIHLKSFQIEDGKKLTHCVSLSLSGLFLIGHGQPVSCNHIYALGSCLSRSIGTCQEPCGRSCIGRGPDTSLRQFAFRHAPRQNIGFLGQRYMPKHR